jgi:hypothetical protein
MSGTTFTAIRCIILCCNSTVVSQPKKINIKIIKDTAELGLIDIAYIKEK